METPVGSVAIAGATLAQIMHDFGSVEGDSDGILFGRLQHQTTTRMQDDDDAAGPAIAQESVTARVTGYFCSGKVQSFYDSTGRLNHSKLSSIVTERQSRGEDPLIGWFLGRRNSTLLPSMREAAVTAYLRLGSSSSPPQPDAAKEKSDLESELTPVSSPKSLRRRPSLEIRQSGPVASASSSGKGSQEERMEPISPCFLVLFTETDARDNAVRTHEYRAFQSLQSAKGLSFDPLPVKIVNSGLSMRASYDSFAPVASIPSWANQELNRGMGGNDATTESREGGKSNSRRSTSRGGQDSAGAALENLLGNTDTKGSTQSGGGFRVSQFEGLYEQMLTRLEMLSNEAHDSSVALRKTQEQRNPILHK